MRFIVIWLFCLVIIGCDRANVAATDGDGASPDIAELARDYKKLVPMTDKAVFVNPAMAMLCRGASKAEVEGARLASGPHAHTAVRIYMNQLAAGAFREAAGAFPVGSVIVKEKSALAYREEGPDKQGKMTKPHDGVGGMIKRSAGYDAQHGDWEYFYFEDPAKIESGKISSCVECHAGAKTSDYVFGGWAK